MVSAVCWTAVCSTEDDARLAIQLQKDELLLRRKQRTEREAEDLVYNHILLDHVPSLPVRARREVTVPLFLQFTVCFSLSFRTCDTID